MPVSTNLLVTFPRCHATGSSRFVLCVNCDTPLTAVFRHGTPGLPSSGDYAQLGAEGVGQCRDERQFRTHLASGEQPSHARSVAVDTSRELGLGDAKIDPQRVQCPDHRVGLGDLAGSPLIS